MNSVGVVQRTSPRQSVAIQAEHLHRRRDRDRQARRRDERRGERAEAGSEHVMRPQREADDAGRDQRGDDGAVAGERLADHRRQHRRDPSRRRQEDDVDLGVAEEPEQVLPQERVAAALGDEERPVEGALHLEQRGAGDDRREREHDHRADDEHRPGEDRHARQRHAGRARHQDADDQLDRAGDRADLDEADAEQPEVGVEPGRVDAARQRRVHEPAAVGRQADEQGAEERQTADRVRPVGIRRQARERQVARAEHVRQQIDRERLDHRHGEQEHHHRAVHREDLVVGSCRKQRVAGQRELRPHQEAEHAGEQQEEQRGRDVQLADVGVVDGA